LFENVFGHEHENDRRGKMRRRDFLTTAFAVSLLAAPASAADMPGVTASEIKIGQTMPYSGPASAYGTYGRSEVAYFKMINEQGGVNGRQINLISVDDGYSPPKAVEQVRRLAEQENVAFFFNTLGTPSNTAIQKYLNEHKIPQLFVATGASKWGDPEHFHWTMGWQPDYRTEARIYAKYILKSKPAAKIAVLYQNDDFGKDYLIGLKEGLGADKAAKMIVSEASYEVTDTSIDSQVVSLQASSADTLVVGATPKFAAQAIRKVYDIGWKPLFLMTNVSASVGTVIDPAGRDKAVGIISAGYLKDPVDPTWKDDPAMKQWRDFMAKYYPEGDVSDVGNVYGYTAAATMVQVLKQCGNDLSRENVMKQAASLRDLTVPTTLPGIKISTGATDYYPIKQMQLQTWDGKSWKLFGDLLSGESS
jgi:branched-chain amino acid transport system substrate-binding protein